MIAHVVNAVGVKAPVAYLIGELGAYIDSADHSVESAGWALKFDDLDTVSGVAPSSSGGHAVVWRANHGSGSVSFGVVTHDAWCRLVVSGHICIR